MCRRKLPEKPWEDLAIDLMGPLPRTGEYLLVVVDYFSRYFEVVITPYWPQANGEVERQNRSLLKRLQISAPTGKTGN